MRAWSATSPIPGSRMADWEVIANHGLLSVVDLSYES
jgi:hypothetical protein